mgnify:CR=1 FL=1
MKDDAVPAHISWQGFIYQLENNLPALVGYRRRNLRVAAGSSPGRIPFPETGNPIWPFHQLCLLLRSTAPLTAKLDFFTLRRRGRPGGKPAKVVHIIKAIANCGIKLYQSIMAVIRFHIIGEKYLCIPRYDRIIKEIEREFKS